MLFDVIRKIPHDYLCILDGYETLFQDHLTTLKRTLEDHPDKIAAYSGTFLDSQDTNRYRVLNGRIPIQEIYNCYWPNGIVNLSGTFLMDKRIEKYLTEYICSCIDGLEVSALLNISLFKHKEKLVYSERISCSCYEALIRTNFMTMSRDKQINFIHGLIVYEYENWMKEHVGDSNCVTTPSPLESGLYKKLLIIYKVWLQSAIECRKTGLLFAWEDSKRAKVRAKIQALKEEREQIKHKIKTM